MAFATPPRYGAPDLLFFEKSVSHDLHERCASCHSDPEMAAGFSLTPYANVERPDPALVLRNFRAAVKFVDPERPGESPLLLKGMGAGGHPELYQSRAARDFEHLQHFAMGATLKNRPPAAIVQKRYVTEPGKQLELDGTLSADPDQNELQYRWRVVERPAGSVADIAADAEGGATFTADRNGVYRIELLVSDGTLWSLPAGLMVVATARKPAPSGMSDGMGGGGTKPSMPGQPKARPRSTLVDGRLDERRLKLIRRLYLDLKRRTPHLVEIEQWYPKSHAEMVDAFLQDDETWGSWYEHQLFYFLLLDGFRPNEGRITTIPARVRTGKITVLRGLEEIVRSQYFGARNPGNDTFVTVVLEQCLGLVVQERNNLRLLELGKKMYDGYRVKLFKESGQSQADFVRIVFKQPGLTRHLLRRTWKVLIGADPVEKQLKFDADRLTANPKLFVPILREWLTSPAYTKGVAEGRTKGEIPYVRGLFVDTLGRLPSYDELRNVRNAFLSLADPTPVRLVMGRVLLQSPEVKMPASSIDATRFVKEQFIRLFARPATNREVETFVNALKNDPQVTPGVVLWTLISSPEYQSY